MSDIVYINEEEGKKRLMNSVKAYVKFLTKFKNEITLDDLVGSANSNNWESARTAAHTIKGLAANLSLTELFNQALDIETQAKEQSVKPESLESLKICFTETLTAIDKVINKYA